MNIKDCTKTVGGHPWRFYADGAGGAYPVHGAYCWQDNWYAGEWTPSGKFHYSNHINSEYDLDLRDWRDQIPWECIRDEVEWVAWDNPSGWRGFNSEPRLSHCPDVWMRGAGVSWELNGIKMPQPPADWREAIAWRPE